MASHAAMVAVELAADPKRKRLILEYMHLKGFLFVDDITPSAGPPNVIIAHAGRRSAPLRCDVRQGTATRLERFQLSPLGNFQVELTPSMLQKELR